MYIKLNICQCHMLLSHVQYNVLVLVSTKYMLLVLYNDI